jgi:hydroxyacylglutathione hydrolase
MLVERIWSGNAYRNFHYLIACPQTGEALAVDPLEWQLCLDTARARGWQITQILNTHEHRDHTGGNAGLVGATQAKVLAHAGAAGRIGGVDRGLARGDVVRVGRTVELECLDTPGHTMAHICLLAHAPQPALFCGDTLFNAGAGNCHGGGHPDALYDTLPNLRGCGRHRVYPGHEHGAQSRVTPSRAATATRRRCCNCTPYRSGEYGRRIARKREHVLPRRAPAFARPREAFPTSEEPDARTFLVVARVAKSVVTFG